MFKKEQKSADETEKTIEKYRFWQIICGGIIGFLTGFLPMFVNYVHTTLIDPPIHCEGKISITYPKNKTTIYGDEVDIAGTVDPTNGCKNIFLVVGTLNGHTYFVTDFVTVNPDGTWDAAAKLQIVPYGTRARIQARLCGKPNAYPPEGCLPEVPSKGVASNSVIISREAGLPRNTAKHRTIGGAMVLKMIEFSSIASGQVIGVGNKYKDYKVVVYAKDTKYGWHKQPYPSNEQGYGWAALQPDGSWSIQLRNRPTQKMFTEEWIILLMHKNEEAPNRVKGIDSLNFIDKAKPPKI